MKSAPYNLSLAKVSGSLKRLKQAVETGIQSSIGFSAATLSIKPEIFMPRSKESSY